MSDKRFEFYSDEDLIGVLDIVTGRTFNSFEIVDKLNEQQEIIIELKDDKNQLHKVISKLRQEVAELKTRNSVLSSRLNEDQIQKCWKSYTTIFGLTMSEKTLIQHFCEYLLNGVWKYDE